MGRLCKELPAFIIKRLPVRLTFDNNYFEDLYQGVPVGGYNQLIEKLLAGVECKVNCDFIDWHKAHWHEIAEKLVYTGPLDAYFDYKLGMLDWRSLSFKTRVENTPDFQGNAVINYTSHEQPYTRIIEHKHFEMFGKQVSTFQRTVITEEYSVKYEKGLEPYYPINDERNNVLTEQYRTLATQEKKCNFWRSLGRISVLQYGPGNR